MTWQEQFIENIFVLYKEQPRHPKGHPKGGQWKTAGSGATFDKESKQWKDEDGIPLPAESQERLRQMGTPPGWTDVRLNPDPKAGLQVVGRDAKNRWQSIYSAEHTNKKEAEKWERIKRLNPKMDDIMDGSQKRMTDSSISQSDRDSATALYLITQTGMRPGSSRDTKAAKKAYGVTTLEGRQVDVNGSELTFNFTGKKGIRQHITITNKALADYIKRKNAGSNNKIFPTTNLRKALNSVGGEGFMVKDIRTWKGTQTALKEVKKMPVPKTKKEFKKSVKTVATKVSEVLGNTPTVALKSYIAPQVFHKWETAVNIK